MKCFFSAYRLFSSGRGSVLALSAAGHGGGPACMPRQKCGSRPGSVALVLGLQSREIWRVVAGLLYDQLELTRPIQTPKRHVLLPRVFAGKNDYDYSHLVDVPSMGCWILFALLGREVDMCLYLFLVLP